LTSLYFGFDELLGNTNFNLINDEITQLKNDTMIQINNDSKNNINYYFKYNSTIKDTAFRLNITLTSLNNSTNFVIYLNDVYGNTGCKYDKNIYNGLDPYINYLFPNQNASCWVKTCYIPECKFDMQYDLRFTNYNDSFIYMSFRGNGKFQLKVLETSVNDLDAIVAWFNTVIIPGTNPGDANSDSDVYKPDQEKKFAIFQSQNVLPGTLISIGLATVTTISSILAFVAYLRKDPKGEIFYFYLEIILAVSDFLSDIIYAFFTKFDNIRDFALVIVFLFVGLAVYIIFALIFYSFNCKTSCCCGKLVTLPFLLHLKILRCQNCKSHFVQGTTFEKNPEKFYITIEFIDTLLETIPQMILQFMTNWKIGWTIIALISFIISGLHFINAGIGIIKLCCIKGQRYPSDKYEKVAANREP
jgi:hypothetical protein